MSFYLEESDEEGFVASQQFSQSLSQSQTVPLSLSQPSSQQRRKTTASQRDLLSEENFHCLNCDSVDCYLDELTGNLVCSECFTQSQTLVAASQHELEFDDTMALAGRGRRGNLMHQGQKAPGAASSSGTPRGGGAGRLTSLKKKSKPMEEYDQSVVLPDVKICIVGLQFVLKECSRILCELALSQQSDAVSVALPPLLEAVKAMWNAYLRGWYEGAAFYGPKYPEVRFCFRDAFLPSPVKLRLLKNLSYQVVKELKQEKKEEQNQQVKMKEEPDDSPSSSPLADRTSTKRAVHWGKSAINSKKNVRVSNVKVKSLDDEGTDRRLTKDQLGSSTTTSLNRKSDPTLVGQKRVDSGSDLWKMVYHHHRQGPGKIRKLGRIATALLLQPSMAMVASILLIAGNQLGVTPGQIRKWIGNGSLPLMNAYSLLPAGLQKELKPIKSFFRSYRPPSLSLLQYTVTMLHVGCGYKPRKIMIRSAKGGRREAPKSRAFKPGRLLSVASVPLTAVQLATVVGFGQEVLDYAFALMGRQPVLPNLSKYWLPPPLKKSRPDNLLEPARIMALLLVAYKLTPAWKKLTFTSDGVTDLYQTAYVSPGGPIKRQRTGDARGLREVPWTEDMYRTLFLGDNMADYLDFLEECILDLDNPVLTKMVDELKPKSTPATLSRLPEQPTSSETRARKVNGGYRRARRQPMVNFYEVSEDQRLGFMTQQTEKIGNVVEFVAVKTDLAPSDILPFIEELDDELRKVLPVSQPVKMNPQAVYDIVFSDD